MFDSDDKPVIFFVGTILTIILILVVFGAIGDASRRDALVQMVQAGADPLVAAAALK